LVRGLREAGVEKLFGYPGGAVLDICDAFAVEDSGIDFILTRHEQGAIFAADGYARATGKTGVCLATSGPGATNLITGLANAHMDSVPVVAITGQVTTRLLGTDAFQEADTFGITLPITKHNYLVASAGELPQVLRQAFHIASTGRRGPVLVDIPRDVAQSLVSAPSGGDDLGLPGYQPTAEGHPVMLRRAAEALLAAEKPLIWAGGGVIASGAADEVRRLAELTGAPVMMSLMGLGALPHHHPLSLGMLGMHGTPWANWAAKECDLLLALGVRFDDRATGRLESFAPHAALVHIDIDPAEIGKLRKPMVPVVADLGVALPALRELVAEQRQEGRAEAAADGLPVATARWRRAVAKRRSETRWPQVDRPDCRLHPVDVLSELGRQAGPEAVVVADVGQHQMFAAQLYPVGGPRRFLTSGGLGSMGYAVPAAMGAQAGLPESTVLAVVGDGGFQMTGNELATIADWRLPVKIVIINNGYLGMVRQWQELFFERRYMAARITGPDFVKLAEAYGVRGLRVESSAELGAAVAQTLAHPGPVVLDCIVEAEANVFPIVPPGKGSEDTVEVGSMGQ